MSSGYATDHDQDSRGWKGAPSGTACSRDMATGLVQRVHGWQQPVVRADSPNKPTILVADTADLLSLLLSLRWE